MRDLSFVVSYFSRIILSLIKIWMFFLIIRHVKWLISLPRIKLITTHNLYSLLTKTKFSGNLFIKLRRIFFISCNKLSFNSYACFCQIHENRFKEIINLTLWFNWEFFNDWFGWNDSFSLIHFIQKLYEHSAFFILCQIILNFWNMIKCLQKNIEFGLKTHYNNIFIQQIWIDYWTDKEEMIFDDVFLRFLEEIFAIYKGMIKQEEKCLDDILFLFDFCNSKFLVVIHPEYTSKMIKYLEANSD